MPQADVPLTFERLEGLSHNTVLSLLQDHQGFLWIGTADGLDRYDGHAVAVYRHNPRDTTSLSHNTIRALVEDDEERLWIGTDDGVSRFDRSAQRFVRYALPNDGLRRTRVFSLELDGEGRLWGTTFEDPDGVFRYDEAADAFVRYPIRAASSPARVAAPLVRFAVDGEGHPWALLDGPEQAGLFRYDAAGDGFLPTVPAASRLPPRLIQTAHAGVWAADGDVLGPLDLATRHFEPAVHLREAPTHIRIVEARDGVLWIGTETGLYRSGPTAGSHAGVVADAVTFYRVDSTETASLSNYVWTLYEDRAGIVWVGTRSGLFRYDPNEKPFVHLDLPGNTTVMDVHGDEQDGTPGALWIGTLGGGLVHLDRATRSTTTYRHTPGDAHSLPDDRVWVLHSGDDGRLWLGTEAGLSVFDPRTGRFTSHPLPHTRASTHPEGVPAVYTLTPAPGGRLWVGGPWDVYLFDPSGGGVMRHLPLGRRLGFAVVQDLHVSAASPETLWIGTESAGLARYDTASGALTRYPTAAHDSTGLPGETVWTIHEDARGHLWLGTDLGLVRFDPSTETSRSFYDPDAHPGALVYSLLEDDRGRLWMGTSQGLARFDPQTETLRHYDRSDGTGNVEFNRRAAFRSADGSLFFGGLDGVTTFRPEAIRDNPFIPPVAVTQMEVFEGQGARTFYPEDRERLQLSHRENTFELAFAALSFTDPQKNRYAYRLDGFDEAWIEAGTNRRARYTHVPPGDYVFRVRAANNDGVWNDDGAAVRLSIAPPFWQTWWFRVFILAAGLGLVMAAYRTRVRHLLTVERLRLRIASDLHDDIGSKLSSIALLSEMVRDRTALPGPDRAELTRIGTVARQLVDALRDIVWFIEPEHDRPGVLAEKMGETASGLLAGTAHTFHCPPTLTLDTADVAVRRNVFLIYKEALHNVVRHAHAGTVTITVRDEAGAFRLTIADDGAGFDSQAAAAGHGLANMRRRAAEIGAELNVASQPGAGTTVRLSLPNNVDA